MKIDELIMSIQSVAITKHWAFGLGYLSGAILLGLVLVVVFHRIARGVADRAHNPMAVRVIDGVQKPLMILVPLLLIRIFSPLLPLEEEIRPLYDHLLSLSLIFASAYGAAHLVAAVRDGLLDNHNLSNADNLKARRAATQVRLLARILLVAVWFVAISAMLMTFNGIRQIGVSLLASAGVAGIVLGIAAQKTLGNLLAGIQIAFTQPIRIDDVVIVEGEWGRIEEITLTFVVVRIWDLRRLIVPIHYFIEKPFENWTRVSAEILGTVYLYTDYTVPVDAIRKKTRQIVEDSEMWNEKVCVVQVTDCKPETMEVRLLVSAADASTAWNLRCHLRESILDFVQKEYPEALPRTRAELFNPREERSGESHPARETEPVEHRESESGDK